MLSLFLHLLVVILVLAPWAGELARALSPGNTSQLSGGGGGGGERMAYITLPGAALPRLKRRPRRRS